MFMKNSGLKRDTKKDWGLPLLLRNILHQVRATGTLATAYAEISKNTSLADICIEWYAQIWSKLLTE